MDIIAETRLFVKCFLKKIPNFLEEKTLPPSLLSQKNNKKRMPFEHPLFRGRTELRSSCGVALAAVYSLAFGRIEGHLAFLAAVCAYGIEHLSRSLGAVLSCITACLASLGLVLEALLSIEFLLTGGEHEIVAAIFALQCLVLVHLLYLTLIGKKFFCPQTDSNRRL